MTPLEELALLLRPAGGGVYLVSSGRAEQQAAERLLYRAKSGAEVLSRFRERLRKARGARAVILGVPSDAGAGYLRGANQGPLAIRRQLALSDPGFFDRAEEAGLVDLGDVFTVPQLLHDEMLSEEQKTASRRALYPEVRAEEAARLPVSPLSMAERALDLVLQENPRVVPILLGGDHSAAWPAVAALHRVRPRMGILQVDAHTDLLAERLGVKYCFGTWSFHANELLGRGGRLVQVGVRASGRDRGHWERTTGVRQIWASEARADPPGSLDRALSALREAGVDSVYFTNDIDGTDETFADATGTPEPAGLHPDFVVELLRRAGREVGLAGGDVMEVAPALGRTPGGAERTLDLAVRYLRETAAAALGAPV